MVTEFLSLCFCKHLNNIEHRVLHASVYAYEQTCLWFNNLHFLLPLNEECKLFL